MIKKLTEEHKKKIALGVKRHLPKSVFKKNSTPWNKGTKGIMKAWNKGKKCLNISFSKIGHVSGMKGKHHSEESKIRIGRSNSLALMGKIQSEETKLKRSIRIRGNNNPFWKGGITTLQTRIRHSYKYKVWSLACMQRDNFTCQGCRKRGGYLEVHHIKSFASLIKDNNINSLEEGFLCLNLWSIDNGVTLCLDCHKKTDTYLRKGILDSYTSDVKL